LTKVVSSRHVVFYWIQLETKITRHNLRNLFFMECP